jgi:hypothetical protein
LRAATRLAHSATLRTLDCTLAQLKAEIPLFTDQEIIVRTTDVPLRSSALLSSALQASTQTHTSTIVTRDTPKSYVHSYLDSELLGDYLWGLQQQIEEEHWSEGGNSAHHRPADKEEEQEREREQQRKQMQASPADVVKIYLFDLSETKAAELLLLDRFHQAVGLSSHRMVVGIQTGGTRALLDHLSMGAPVSIDPRNATRALLAQTVNVAFGLASPERSFLQATNQVHVDWRFSAVHSPYGPFSKQTTLPFFVRDAISRLVFRRHVRVLRVR